MADPATPARSSRPWQVPRLWRILQVLARATTTAFCRLQVTGDLPEHLRGGPLLLAINHIGVFDPIAVVSACRVRGLAPRMMATGGLFATPVVGPVLRACGLIRVNRSHATASQALSDAAVALASNSTVAMYPEGRIGLDPALWPERGKTGLARLALATGAPVVVVAQWGAHEVMAWHGWPMMAARLVKALVTRPVVRVHFGPQVDLTGLPEPEAAAIRVATDRIITLLGQQLAPLRADEPGLPRYEDPTRPLCTARAIRHPEPAADTPNKVETSVHASLPSDH